MTRTQLIADLNTYITTNGTGAITGAILNNILNEIVTMQISLPIICGSGGYAISGGGTTLTGDFFNYPTNWISSGGQFYTIGAHFTQTGNAITWLLVGQLFTTGDNIVAGY